MNFSKTETGIEGLYIIEPKIFGDERGYFMESYVKQDFVQMGIDVDFVQDNESLSSKGVLRGLHIQNNFPQAKLIRVQNGSIIDVVLDLRRNSQTYGHWFKVELTSSNHKMLYVPKGFAHGFLALEDQTRILYKASDYYHPEDEDGIIYNDETLNINWPVEGIDLLLSDKDQKLKTFEEYNNCK